MRNATISIAEINNGFLATTAGQSQYGLIGGPPTNSVQHYPTLEALVADANRIIGAALDAAVQEEAAQARAVEENRRFGSLVGSLGGEAANQRRYD